MVIEDKREKEDQDLIILPYRILLVKRGEIKLIHEGNKITLNDKKELVIDKGWLFNDIFKNPSVDANLLVKFSDELERRLSDDIDLSLKKYIDGAKLK